MARRARTARKDRARRSVELARDERDRAADAVADDLERAAGADPLLGHQPLEVVDAADGHAVDADDQVLGAQAGAGGRRALDHLDDLDRAVAARATPATRGGSGRAPPAMPIQARRTRPSRIRAETIRRVVALIGTASPSPIPATAVLMPTTRPRPSTSAPPELPGLSAASVWMTSSMMRVAPPGAGGQRAAERGDHAGGDRARVAVRVADRHDELADAQRARVAQLRRLQPRRLGAQDGEVRQRVGADDPRLEVAAVDERGPHPRAACPPTTCALVSMNPSGVITTPEPPPVLQRRRFEIRRLATDGPSVSATRVTTRE